MSKRTTHRSAKTAKPYAVRDKKGKFKDIQTYKRAHTSDVKRTRSSDELQELSERFSQAMKRLAKR